MGLWIELRCDRLGDRCWSNNNDGPKGMMPDGAQHRAKTIARLLKQGRKSGWQTRGAIVCPECRKDPK